MLNSILFQNISSDVFSGVVCGGIVLLILVGLVLLYLSGAKGTKKDGERFAKIKTNYFDALRSLQGDPQNTALKTEVIRLGTYYGEQTKRYKKLDDEIVIYDEQTLAKDVDAACANIGVGSNFPRTENSKSVKERLLKLSELREKDLISESEYQQKRTEILEEI